VENVPQPEQYIDELLKRVKHEHISQNYPIDRYSSVEDFLEKLVRKSGKFLKAADPDLPTVAKTVLTIIKGTNYHITFHDQRILSDKTCKKKRIVFRVRSHHD
jgi:hypothetical protein